jgi:hypothetical protein
MSIVNARNNHPSSARSDMKRGNVCGNMPLLTELEDLSKAASSIDMALLMELAPRVSLPWIKAERDPSTLRPNAYKAMNPRLLERLNLLRARTSRAPAPAYFTNTAR